MLDSGVALKSRNVSIEINLVRTTCSMTIFRTVFLALHIGAHVNRVRLT